MQFVPYYMLGETPNLVVDGYGNLATVCILSHWPHSGTKKELKDDLSAQIVFRYLDRPNLHVAVDAASNDHFDEDGLISLYSVLNPAQAQKNRDLLIDIANAGDFGKYHLREAARVSFVLAAYADKEQSPLDKSLFDKPYPEWTAGMYKILLPLLPEIIAAPEKYRTYWEDEELFLNASEAAIASGQIKIEEKPEIDLAVVTLPDRALCGSIDKLAFSRRQNSTDCHQMAIHNLTDCFRVLMIKDRKYELYFRYETWVQYMSKKPMQRVDLSPLAQELSKQEAGNGQWVSTGAKEITPRLQLIGASESKISPADFLKQVESFLSKAKPAWDPYDK